MVITFQSHILYSNEFLLKSLGLDTLNMKCPWLVI